MDPLSIVTSTLTLAGALAVTLQTAQEIFAGRSELNALSDEVADLLITLQTTEQVLSGFQHTPLQENFRFGLACQSISSKLRTMEELIAQWLRESTSYKHRLDLRRLNWIRIAPKLTLLKRDLCGLKSQLLILLGSITATKACRIQLDLPLLGDDSRGAHNRIEQHLEANHAEQLKYLREISSRFTTPIAQRVVPELCKDGIPTETTRLILDQPGPVVGQPSLNRAFRGNSPVINESKMLTAISAVGIRTSHFPRAACTPWCMCACHVETTVRTPSCIRGLVGSLVISCSGICMMRSKCNEHSCHVESQPMVYCVYFFPTWLLTRMISFMISVTPLAGPVVSLKMNRTVSGDADIFYYAKTGNVERMKYLFENGLASPHDVSASSGITALHFAISYQQIEICNLLLGANADPFLEDHSRWTPADNAWSKILSGRFPREKEGQLRLMFCDTEYVERWSFTILHKIVLGLSHKDLGIELASSTAEINTMDANGRTPLSFAAERNDIKALTVMLRNGADPCVASPAHGSPLHFAATALEPAAISLLISHGAKVDYITAHLQTPLHYAAAYNHDPRHATELLEAGANPNYQDADGMTPLHWCVVSQNLPVASAILRHGCDINLTDKQGESMLSRCVRSNSHKLLELLTTFLPSVDILYIYKRTILHIAADEADKETMDLLSRLEITGLDVVALDADGLTALDIFESRKENMELRPAFNLLSRSTQTYTASMEESMCEEDWQDAVEVLQ